MTARPWSCWCNAGSARPRSARSCGARSYALLQRAHGVEARVALVPPKALPQTSSGKLSRSKAKANYLSGAYEQFDQAVGA
jgi:fatty-acyl-CoA synthase